MRFYIVLMMVACFLSACGSSGSSSNDRVVKTKWIMDHDANIDDFTAIMQMLLSPKVEMVGMVIDANGCSYYDDAWKNTTGIMELLGYGQDSMALAMGEAEPLDGFREYPAGWREDANAVCGDFLPTAGWQVPERSACDLYIDLLKSASEKISILCTGTWTNLALAVKKDPSIVQNIDRIVCMAGAFKVPGNIRVPGFTDHLKDKVSEWNVFIDPVALEIVVKSGVRIEFVPLDATNQAPVDEDFMLEFISLAQTPAAEFQANIFEIRMHGVDTGEYYFWDPLAAGVALDSSLAVDLEPEKMFVNYSFVDYIDPNDMVNKGIIPDFNATNYLGEPRRQFAPENSGQCVIDEQSGAEVDVCYRADVVKFKLELVDILNSN